MADDCSAVLPPTFIDHTVSPKTRPRFSSKLNFERWAFIIQFQATVEPEGGEEVLNASAMMPVNHSILLEVLNNIQLQKKTCKSCNCSYDHVIEIYRYWLGHRRSSIYIRFIFPTKNVHFLLSISSLTHDRTCIHRYCGVRDKCKV